MGNIVGLKIKLYISDVIKQQTTMKTVKLNNNQSIIVKALVNTTNFYAEPGFSDVSPEDVIEMVKDQLDATTVKRTLTSLYKTGLFFTDTFEDYAFNGTRWADRKYTIIYLSESIYHMVDWDKNYYGESDIEDVQFEYTTEAETIKEVNPTGPRGPLAQLTGESYNISDPAQKDMAIKLALNKTDLKNANTAMAKFIKSNKFQARYYGLIITKK